MGGRLWSRDSIRVMSAEAIHGVNELEINGQRYLLAGGNKTHLVALGAPETALRAAVDRGRCERDGEWQFAYDLAALLVEQWQPNTVCGRRWQIMRAGDGPPIGPFAPSAHAPDCKTCLRIVSKELKSSPVDDRIGLVASLAIEEAMQRGSANISGAPGDQVDALRSAIREASRAQGARNRMASGGSP